MVSKKSLIALQAFSKNAVVGLATAAERAKVKSSKTGRSFRDPAPRGRAACDASPRPGRRRRCSRAPGLNGAIGATDPEGEWSQNRTMHAYIRRSRKSARCTRIGTIFDVFFCYLKQQIFFLLEQTMNYFSWDVTWVTFASRFVRVIRVCLSSQYVINIGDEERKCWQPFANVPANEEATNTCPTLTECFSKGLSMEKVQNDV